MKAAHQLAALAGLTGLTIAIAWSCAPFSDQTVAGCLLGNDSTTSGYNLGPNESNWTALAQSFVLSSVTTISTVNLWLTSNFPVGTSSNNTAILYVMPDAQATTSSTPMPTTPAGGLSLSGSLAQGSLSISNVTPNTLGLYTVTLNTSVRLSPSTPYWLVLNTNTASDAANYLIWESSANVAIPYGMALGLSPTGAWQAIQGATITAGQLTFSFEIGCPAPSPSATMAI